LAALDPFEPLIAAGLELIYGEDFQTVILHHAMLHSLVNNIKNVDKWTWTPAAAAIIAFAHDSVSLVLLLIFCGDNYGLATLQSKAFLFCLLANLLKSDLSEMCDSVALVFKA